MKICLNQRIQYLSESFHKGELSLAEYRELRREAFEQLNNLRHESDVNTLEPSQEIRMPSRQLVKRVATATLLSVALLLFTVMLVRMLF